MHVNVNYKQWPNRKSPYQYTAVYVNMTKNSFKN